MLAMQKGLNLTGYHFITDIFIEKKRYLLADCDIAW